MHDIAERGVDAKDSMELGLGLGLGLRLSALRYDSCRDPVSIRHIFFCCVEARRQFSIQSRAHFASQSVPVI